MKRFTLFTLAVFILTSPALLNAAEQIPFEPSSLPDLDHPVAADAFRVIATSNGKILSHPGPAFTEGGDYEGMTLPYLLSNPQPIPYPKWAVRQGWEGEFVVEVEILANGDVGRYSVTQSTGHELLDEAAIRTIKSWKFEPAYKNGEVTVTCIQIPVRFELQNE